MQFNLIYSLLIPLEDGRRDDMYVFMLLYIKKNKLYKILIRGICNVIYVNE